MVDTGVQITIASLSVSPEAIAQARPLLAADELRRAERFLRDEDRSRFIAARALLRGLLGRELGLAPERVAFVYGRHGKPSLGPSQAAGGLRFNLSHSGGRALLAWTRGREIGADLELIRPVRFGMKIARRFFSDDEQDALRGLEGPEWDAAFFRCWTRKEAFIKAVGDGLSYPLRSFSIPMSEGGTPGPVRVSGEEAASRPWTLQAIDAGPGFLAAVVTGVPGPRSSS